MADRQSTQGSEEFLALARLALAERQQDVHLFLSRLARRYRESEPDLSGEISTLLKNASSRSSGLRRETALPLPVDGDSRLHLVRMERPMLGMASPVFRPSVEKEIATLIRERKEIRRLISAGLEPTRSALFVGPPGIGKTMTARWIAAQLDLPLMILDLSAVMSSFLGRTGNNVRAVLDYAKRQSCVLLLDELDAIAKRRDDATEIGELKRLVTVLLQEIDEWPSHGLLVAATNHPELLDPAVWRRFDMVVAFPPPSRLEVQQVIGEYLGSDAVTAKEWIDVLSVIFNSFNFSDIQKRVASLRRSATISGRPLSEEIEDYVTDVVGLMPHVEKIELAEKLNSVPEISQRRANEITGVSRDTLRRRSNKGDEIGKRDMADG